MHFQEECAMNYVMGKKRCISKIKIDIRPLSINEAYRTPKGARRYKTAQYNSFISALQWLLPKEIELFPKMTIWMEWGIKNTARDVDNPVKPFIDVLQKRYKFNDSRVYKIVAEKVISKQEYIKFEISEYEKV